jgi:hypothetical protein
MEFALSFGGSTVGTTPTLGSSAFAASEAFRWRVSLIVLPITIGSTGTWMASLQGIVCQSANNILPGAGSQDSVPFAGGNSSSVPRDTTTALDLSLTFEWGSTTGGSTITCAGTRYTRCG